MSKSPLILYCRCAYSQIIPDEVKCAVLSALESKGIEFEAVTDLCELAAHHSPELGRWAKTDAMKIIACFGRTVKWLFHAGGAPLQCEDVEFLNMRTDSPESIVGALSECEGSATEREKIDLDKTGEWVPWFPVIDYERCANCKQCLNFCLFGVYGLSEQEQVEVQKPANCKTNCPACARVCPQKAIIFPKYTESPFNGDQVKEDDGEGAEGGAKLSELLGGDIHDVLRHRGKGEQEGVRRLAKLQSALDIPSEVIESLSGKDIAPTKKDCPNAERSKCNRECEGGDS
jgi:Pyruvate/2-oxoacid:ferredoxin oxidoreductase delta subunit